MDGTIEQLPNAPGGYGVALQADGKILTTGQHLFRLHNDPAVQSLTITGDAKVQWMRSGTAPEVGLVTFERSIDSGATWTMLGRGTRISGGWELAVPGLPSGAVIRARGRTAGGRSNANTGIVEQTLNLPVIAVADGNGI